MCTEPYPEFAKPANYEESGTANYCRRQRRRLNNRGWTISWLTNKRYADAPQLLRRILGAFDLGGNIFSICCSSGEFH
jgi:hypothetical protein